MIYVYTEEDRQDPVYCTQCSVHIPRPVSEEGQGLCPSCLAKAQTATTSIPPIPPASAPPVGIPPPVSQVPGFVATPPIPQKKKSKVGLVALCVIGGIFVLCSVGSFLSNQAHAQAKLDPDASKALQGTIAKLKAKYPERKFAAFLGDSATIPLEAQMTFLRVNSLELSRSSVGITADISYTSTADEAIAPEVYLSAFDRSGNELVRAAVVSHKEKDLLPSASSKTPDFVSVENAERVYIVAVDDDPAKRKKELAAKVAAAAEEEKAQAEVAARGPKPVPSKWDGVTPEVNEYLSANLKDYDSLKIVNCSPIDTFGSNAWAQRVKYRARNSFGGYVLEEKLFVIRDGKVINTKDWHS